MAIENIYQMFMRHGHVGFFINSNSWSHPYTAGQVVSVGGIDAGRLPGDPPYFQNPVVIADVADQGRIKREKLSSTGTFAYTEIVRPQILADIVSGHS
jgi:hypothetical protein